MIFKKEFDIDKDFFENDEKKPKKRKIAFNVFFIVLFLTFAFLCLSAITFNSGSNFLSKKTENHNITLKDVQDLYFKGVQEYDNGNYDKAIEFLNMQLEIVDDPDTYNYLGKIYLEKEDTELAIKYFTKAVEYKKDFFEPNFELGKIYFALNDYKNAGKYLSQALSIQDDNMEALALCAEVYKKTGRADDAIALFGKILEKEPDNAFANAKIGEIYYQRMQYHSAINYLEESIKVSMDENAALQLAKCYLELNDLKQSLSVVKDILSVDSENAQAQSLRKTITYKMNLNQKEEKEKQKPTIPNENSVQKPMDKNVLDNYIKQIEEPIKMNWTPPLGSNLKKASVKFTINKDGELIKNRIYESSYMDDFDMSALDAIEMSKPFPPLPEALERETLDIIFTFDFNIKE